MVERIKKNMYYYCLIFLTMIFPIIPKDFGTIFGFIPLRLLLLGILFLIYFYDLFVKKVKMGKPPKLFILIYGIILILMLFGFFKSIDKVQFIYTYIKFLMLGFLVYTLYTYKFDDTKINNLFDTLIFSSIIVSLNGIMNYVLGMNLNYNGIYKYTGALGRTISTFFNPIYLGIFMLVVISLTLYKISTENNKKKLLIYYFSILINYITLLITYTRTVAVLSIIIIIYFVITELFYKDNCKHNIIRYFIIFFFMSFLIFAIPGVKYLYSSTLVNLLPQKTSASLLIFTNKYLKTDFDLELYGIKINKIDNNGNNVTTDNSSNNNNGNSNNNNNNSNNNSKNEQINKVEEVEIDSDFSDASVVSRKEFKNVAKKVIKDNKNTGVGLGNYEAYVLKNKKNYNVKKFGYPHNSFLHLMAESGVITGILLLILIICNILYFLVNFLIRKSRIMGLLFIMWSSILVLATYESLFYDTQLCPILLLITLLLIKKDKIDKPKKVMFIASVGGHLTQMLNIKKLFKKYDYVLVTEKNSVTTALKDTYNIKYLIYGSRQYLFKYIFIFLLNIFKSFYLFLVYNPDIIITTGTHTAVPMCYFGWFFNKKVIYIESFAKRTSPTLSGRIVYKIADTFVIQWETMKQFYPKALYWGGIY